MASEAAEQSERGIVPGVVPAVPLVEAIGPGSVLLWERGEADSRASARSIRRRPWSSAPKGDSRPSEVAAANEAGATLASLGPRDPALGDGGGRRAAVILSRSGDFA